MAKKIVRNVTFDEIFMHVFNAPIDDLGAVNPLQAQRLWQCNAHSIANEPHCAKVAAKHSQAQISWRCDS